MDGSSCVNLIAAKSRPVREFAQAFDRGQRFGDGVNLVGDESLVVEDVRCLGAQGRDLFGTQRVVPMNRTIGTQGETHLCLVLESADIVITAYPSAIPTCST